MAKHEKGYKWWQQGMSKPAVQKLNGVCALLRMYADSCARTTIRDTMTSGFHPYIKGINTHQF